mmetsp:Transcript_95525/g.275827  ORF Transcript_95525/g.275827 Transcript_95525/m.275827 type:complete len:200 (+) Transcript_95525:383-982(+)
MPNVPTTVAQTGMDKPNVMKAGITPHAAPVAPPSNKPSAPPLVPKAKAPPAADAAATRTFWSAEASSMPALALATVRNKTPMGTATAEPRATLAPAAPCSNCSVDWYAAAPMAPPETKPTEPEAMAPRLEPSAPPATAPVGTDKPKVRTAGAVPATAPATEPRTRPHAPPTAPQVAAPPPAAKATATRKPRSWASAVAQ